MKTFEQDPEHLAKAKKKVKELKEAIEVCKALEDKVSWACDFASFCVINNALEPIYESIDDAQDKLERELDYVENQIEDYFFKRDIFENENSIEL